MKTKYLKLGSLVLALWVSGMSFSVSAHQEQNAMIQCQIKAPDSVKLGESLPLTFKLTNTSNYKIMLLKWNTPLEGWFASSFNVTRDGKWVNYTGAMVKRFRPSEEDYATLLAGKSIEATVDMAQGYDIKASGNYKFVYHGRLQDVQVLEGDQPLSKNRSLQKVNCNELTIAVQ